MGVPHRPSSGKMTKLPGILVLLVSSSINAQLYQLPAAVSYYQPLVYYQLVPNVVETSQEQSAAKPLREAVEAQPSEILKAQTRIADLLRKANPPPNVLIKAACEEGGYKSSENCNQYYFCVHGKWTVQSCPNNLHWDNNQRVCNFPDQAGCTCEPGADVDNDVVEVESVEEADEDAPEVEAVIAEEPERPDYGGWDYKPWQPPTPPPRPDYDNKPLTNGLSGDYKIVCYFTNWATYRQTGGGKFDPENIDYRVCTHIIYGFAVLDSNTLLVKSHDPYADMSDGYSGKDMYRKVTEFKKHGIKVTLALGGWNDSKGSKYSKLVNNPAARARFITHVIDFIEKYDFDGLDLDWEYPSCWQTDCKEEHYSDKAAFTAWVSELRAAFNPKGLLLSAAVSPSKKIMDVGYDIPSIARDLDWINVMTYDYHGQWDKKTGHVAPFYGHPDDDYSYFNANFTMNYWIESGAPPKKLVMGMPLYGQSFTLSNKKENGLNAPARDGGAAGPATRAKGFLAYHEICRNIKNGWTVVKDDATPARMGPYAYKGDQWVGFDDTDMIRKKSEYIKEMGLGGGMVWALDLDDFKNKCGEGRYPLMNTIREVLG